MKDSDKRYMRLVSSHHNCRVCNKIVQIFAKIAKNSTASLSTPHISQPSPAGAQIFVKVCNEVANFAKIKNKDCKIATFVAIVRYKIALYNANDLQQIVQIICTNLQN